MTKVFGISNGSANRSTKMKVDTCPPNNPGSGAVQEVCPHGYAMIEAQFSSGTIGEEEQAKLMDIMVGLRDAGFIALTPANEENREEKRLYNDCGGGMCRMYVEAGKPTPHRMVEDEVTAIIQQLGHGQTLAKS